MSNGTSNLERVNRRKPLRSDFDGGMAVQYDRNAARAERRGARRAAAKGRREAVAAWADEQDDDE